MEEQTPESGDMIGVPETAPAPEVTVAPEAAVTQPAELTTPEPRVFTQEELDAIISKRLARERRSWDREQALRQQTQLPQAPTEPLSLEQFESPEAYAQELANRKAAEMLADLENRKHQAEVMETHAEREEKARERFEDYDDVVYNPRLAITEAMATIIRESEVGADIAYYLGTNPKDAERISRLNPFLQAKEIGRIEAKLLQTPPVKRTSSAPAPIKPVTSKVTTIPSYDTTDPRSIASMSTSEWIEAERRRQIRKLEARG